MKKLTRRRKEILTTALNRERRERPAQPKPRNASERQAFDALVQEGYGLWGSEGTSSEGGTPVFRLTQHGRSAAESLRRD